MQDLPYLLKRVHFAFRQTMDDELAKHGLTTAQLDVLSRVANCECAEHRTLLQDMDVASPTLTKLVNSLVQAGLIERRISPEDARVKILVLTATGRALQQELSASYHQFVEQLLDGFSEAERLMFTEFLTRLACNIEELA